MMEVVSIRKSPLVTDIPGQLRQMADDIESGEVEAPASVIFIIDRPRMPWPDIFGWGEHLGDLGNIGLLDLAKAFFLANITRRSGDK